MSQIKNETITGTKWLLLQRFTMQPIQLIYGVVLARLISPEETGILALTAIFFAVAAVLRNAGFSDGLIRKHDRTEEDINTVFWFNIVMNALFGALFFFTAPWIADFFEQPALVWLTRVSAIMMFITASAGVHWTLYTCRRDFKTPAIVSTISALIAMPITIALAYMGWSYWSIVISGVVSSLFNLITVWCISPWRPRWMFSKKSFKELFGFGSRLAASSLLDTGFQHVNSFIIGKFYSPASLGLYNKGSSTTMLPVNTINGILGTVTYPILASIQADESRLISAYKKYIKIASLGIFWGVFTLAALADPLVYFLYGSDWVGCAIYVQLLALSLAFYHIHAINLNIIKVKGRSDLFLRLEIIKKITVAIALLITAPISIEAMCISGIVTSKIALFLNTYYTGKLYNYGIRKQWRDFMPYCALALLAGAPGFLLSEFSQWPSYVLIVVGGSLSFLIYFGYFYTRKDMALMEIINTFAEKGVFTKLQRLAFWRKKK